MDLAATREAGGELVDSDRAARQAVDHAGQVTNPRPDTVRAIWRAAFLLRERGAEDWRTVEALGRSWLEQHGTVACRWLVPRAMAARYQGTIAAGAGNYSEAETQFRRALGLYARAAWWPPMALGVVWPPRALVWHDLAWLHAQRAEPRAAIRLAERETVPILRGIARLRPAAWLRSYADVVVDIAGWAYQADDPQRETYVTRAGSVAQHVLTQAPRRSNAGEDIRALLRVRLIETFVLEDQRSDADADTLAATDQKYAASLSTAADLHLQAAEHTDAAGDWGQAAELAGIAYQQYRRIGETTTSARYLQTAILAGERYVLHAPDPQARTIKRLVDWLLAATDRDPDVAGDHDTIVRYLHRAADLTQQLPRTHQHVSNLAGLYALITEQHHTESNRLFQAAETATTDNRDEQADTKRHSSAAEFVAAAKAGRRAIDLYTDAHRLVEIAEDVTDADQHRAGWIELELQLCERLPEIVEELARMGITGAENRLSELYQRGVSVTRMAWQLLPDRRMTIAPICSHILRQQARHLLVTADHDATAYGQALDHATEAITLDQTYPHPAGVRRPELLVIAFGLIAATRLGDTPATTTLLDRWDQVYNAMLAAGRRNDAAEVVHYLHRRAPELADRLPNVPAPTTTNDTR